MHAPHPYNLAGPGLAWDRVGVRASRCRIWEAGSPETVTDRAGSPSGGSSSERVDELLMRIETVLFLAKEPVSARRLAVLAELPEGSRLRSLIRKLNDSYDAGRGTFQVVEIAGGFQLRTRPKFAPWLFRLQEVPVEIRLSAPAMETLAIVAYKQPVLRAELEAIRGVQCGEMIRQLLDLDLIKISGRSEELGRPFLYVTTARFLQVFGLKSIKDLPVV